MGHGTGELGIRSAPVGSSITSRRRHRSLIAGAVCVGQSSQIRAGATRAGYARRRSLELRKSAAGGSVCPRTRTAVLRGVSFASAYEPSWSWSCSPAAGWAGSSRALACSARQSPRSSGSTVTSNTSGTVTNPARKPGGGPPWPKWLVDRLGVDYFYNVVAVDLDDRATDLELVHVGNLTQLEISATFAIGSDRLRARVPAGAYQPQAPHPESTGVTDAGLAAPERPNQSRRNSPRPTGCSDAGLAHLSALPHLKILGLANTQVTAAGLARLKAANRLEELVLGGTRITDDDMAQLKAMTNLRSLRLGGEDLTDDGLAHLSELPHLKILGLGKTKVTAAGLTRLFAATGLQELVLAGTAVTDEEVGRLKGMTGLKSLSLLRTSVTNEGVDALQQALPNLAIRQ